MKKEEWVQKIHFTDENCWTSVTSGHVIAVCGRPTTAKIRTGKPEDVTCRPCRRTMKFKEAMNHYRRT